MTTEIYTTLPLSEFLEQQRFMEEQFRDAGIHVELCGATVARTWAASEYHEWFDVHGVDWSNHLGWSSYEDDQFTCIQAEMIDSDVTLTWLFDDSNPDEKSMAMLFKLTFGGT